MEGSNRTAIGTSLLYRLYHGVDPNAAGNGEQYSSYGYQYDFTPVQEVGKHELECYAIAYADGFDPNPIVTAAVPAPFTGPCISMCGPATLVACKQSRLAGAGSHV